MKKILGTSLLMSGLAWLLYLCAFSTSLEFAGERRPLPRRVLEPRIAGLMFERCPLVAEEDGLKAACPPSTPHEQAELFKAASQARGALPDETLPSRAETLALLLAAATPQDFSQSLVLLERRAHTRKNVESLTDLSAAYLLRASALGDAEDWLAAHRTAQAALDLDADFPPALFNLALAYERLHLRRSAIETWERLLRVEPLSGNSPVEGSWAEEAEAHRFHLERELANTSGSKQAKAPTTPDLQDRKAAAIEDLFPRWARLAETKPGSPELLNVLKQLEDVAESSRATGDPFLADALQALARGTNGNLAKAHLQLAQRRRSLGSTEREACAPGLTELEATFRREGSPFALEALRLEATCAYIQLNLPAAASLSSRWLDEASRRQFLTSAGLASWFRGTVASELGEYAHAQDLYAKATRLFARSGDQRRSAYLRALSANAKARAGDPVGAWRLLHSSLGEMIATGDPRLSATLHEAAFELSLAGMPELGLRYSTESFAADIESPEALTRFDAHWLRCRLLQQVGRHEEAVRELESLARELEGISDSAVRHRLKVLALSVESEIFLEDQPLRTIQAAREAIATYRAVSFDTSPLDLHLQLAIALERTGDITSSLATLGEGLAYFSSQAKLDPEISAKVRLFDRATKLLEEKMQLELRQGQATSSFETLENARASLLLDELGANSASLQEIQSELEPTDFLVEYFFLADKLQAFLVRSDGFSAVPLDLAREDINKSLEVLWNADQGFSDEIAAKLYEELVRPLSPRVGDRLLISTTDELASVPWAALLDQNSHTRLIEQHQLLLIPSASAMLALEKRGRDFSSLTGASALAVGDPAFDTNLNPNLAESLDEARQEAASAAKAFPPGTLLQRESATGSAFLANMATHPLLLFSGHAIAENAEPLTTKLLFAPDERFPTGEITARDLYRRQLPKGALVILSGCKTGGGFGSKIEGRLDLAHPFLASGAGQVILTRQTVYDQNARELMELLFEKLQELGDPWEAFRATQIASIHAKKPRRRDPQTWAIYQFVGSRWSKQRGGPS